MDSTRPAPAVPAVLRRRLTALGVLGLVGLAATLPFTGPEGTGRQWDHLVLALVSGLAWAAGLPVARRLTGRARTTALVVVVGSLLFLAAQLLTGLGIGEGYGRRSLPDLLVSLAALAPLVVCVRLAREARDTRWSVLAVNALTSALALSVPAVEFVTVPADRQEALTSTAPDVVSGFALYAALALGGAAGLCTVVAAALRRAAAVQLLTASLFALGSAALAKSLVSGDRWWELVADVAVLAAVLLAVVVAVLLPNGALVRPRDRSPQVLVSGAALSLAAVAALPASLLACLALGRSPSDWSLVATAAVVALMLARAVARYRDRTELVQDLVRRDDDVRELVSVVSDEVAVLDADLRLVVVSPAARALLGLPPHDVAGADDHDLLDLVDDADAERVAALLQDARDTTRVVRFALRPGPGRAGAQVEATVLGRPRTDRQVLHLRDATDHHRRERELERLAFTDHLTELPNRAALATALDATDDGDRCLLLLDLDGFKAVNDGSGHDAGDRVLVEVAQRLQRLVRTGDLAARVGGDEFALVLAGDLHAATEAAQRVIAALSRPYRVGPVSAVIGVSIGIARLAPGTEAMRAADDALRAAKDAGKGCWRTAGNDGPATGSGDVLAAVADGSLQLRFDALSDVRSGQVIGLDAGLRWEHPELGVLSAAEVWSAAGRQGTHRELRRWMLVESCRTAVGAAGVHVGVPLCPELAEPGTLAADVAHALAATGLAPERLALSFPEELLQSASSEVPAALRAVHDTGVHLALSGHGLGTSLWGILARVPVDAVVVSLPVLAATGSPDTALRALSGITRSAREVRVQTILADVTSPSVIAQVGAMGVLGMTGPLLPSGLTAAEATALVAPREHTAVG